MPAHQFIGSGAVVVDGCAPPLMRGSPASSSTPWASSRRTSFCRCASWDAATTWPCSPISRRPTWSTSSRSTPLRTSRRAADALRRPGGGEDGGDEQAQRQEGDKPDGEAEDDLRDRLRTTSSGAYAESSAARRSRICGWRVACRRSWPPLPDAGLGAAQPICDRLVGGRADAETRAALTPFAEPETPGWGPLPRGDREDVANDVATALQAH